MAFSIEVVGNPHCLVRKGTYLKVLNHGCLLNVLMRAHLGDWEGLSRASAAGSHQLPGPAAGPSRAVAAALR